jgi:hypothetical protein
MEPTNPPSETIWVPVSSNDFLKQRVILSTHIQCEIQKAAMQYLQTPNVVLVENGDVIRLNTTLEILAIECCKLWSINLSI